MFSLIFAIDKHPFFLDASMTFSHAFSKLCAFLCAFCCATSGNCSEKYKKVLNPIGIQDFYWWRLLDSNQWPPACERIGKTFSDCFQPYPTQKNPHSKLSDHPLPRRVRWFRTALWLFMWSKPLPAGYWHPMGSGFLVCRLPLYGEVSNSFYDIHILAQITTP